MRYGCYWSQLIGGAILALMLAPGAAFGLPTLQVVIGDPTNQSGVTEHSTVTISGTGCPAGEEVVAEFNQEQVATAAVEADGSFVLTFTVPPVPAGIDDILEGRESSIRVTCGGEADAVVVVWSDATLPVTGIEVGLVALIGGLLLAIGLGLLGVSSRRMESR